MKTTFILASTLLTAGMAMAQVVIPDGTPIRVRLQQNLSSETAELGQTVDFSVTQDVRVGENVVIANGAPVTGSIVSVNERGRMGRAGHLDFSIERVQMVDGNWLNLRYTPMKNKGKGSGMSSGIITAGIAVVFWPAAPLGLLKKGQDATIIKGRTYEVFSDENTFLASAPSAGNPQFVRAAAAQQPIQQVRNENPTFTNAAFSNAPAPAGALPGSSVQASPTPASGNAGIGTLTINCSTPGADIELDGMFVGSAPATIQVPSGTHHLAVSQGASIWEHDIQVYTGSVNINATLGKPAPARTAAR